MPTLSVVMPNFNHAGELPRALDALLAQSAPADEIIVVDDGSTDESAETIALYASHHPTVRLLRHERNRGIAAAFNHGLNAATGEYVYGAGANDEVQPGFFAHVRDAIEAHPGVGLVFGHIDCVDRGGRRLDTLRVPAWNRDGFRNPNVYRHEHLERDPAGASLSAATVYRRDALVDVGGFREELSFATDLFAARALGLRHGVYYLDRVCVRWTHEPTGYSPRLSQDVDEVCRVGDRLFVLMASPEFTDAFPEDHRQRWRTRWRLEMERGYDHIADDAVPRRLRDVRRAYAELSRGGRWFDRVLGGALRVMFFGVDCARARRPRQPVTPGRPSPASTDAAPLPEPRAAS